MKLQDVLKNSTVDQLQDIARNWCMQGVSRLNKAKLTEEINKFILKPENLTRMLLHLEPKEMEFMRSGCSSVKTDEDYIYSPYLFLLDRSLTIVQNDMEHIVPDDIYKLVKKIDTPEFKQQFERLALIRKYAVAFVELYGLIPVGKAAEIYCSQTGDTLTGDELLDMADEPVRPFKFTVVYKDYLAHEALWLGTDDNSEAEKLLSQQGDKPFYIPPKQELLKYADDIYFERNDQYNAMKQYIQRHYPVNEEELEEVCSDIQGVCQAECNMDIVLDEMDRHGIVITKAKQLEEFLPYIMNLMNHTRIWSNRGYTPMELHQKHPTIEIMKNELIVQPEKVGRNDPCPCGSGKKYKKCCGADK